MSKKIKEAGSAVGGIKGFQGPLGATKNPNKPYEKKVNMDELFEAMVVEAALDDEDIGEVVRKKGERWIHYDDDTEAQLGSYPDRDTAWDRQRIYRRQKSASKKAKKSESERQMQALTPTLAPAAKQAKSGAKQKRKPKRQNEVKNPITERSAVAYMFGNSTVEDSKLWDTFVSRLSKQLIMSDDMLKHLIQQAAQAEIGCLKKSMNTIRKGLPGYTFHPGKFSKDEENNIKANFMVILKGDNDTEHKLPFELGIDNGRPTLVFPPETKEKINMLSNDESKRLRAEMIHMQETVLSEEDMVAKVHSKRDEYLKKLEGKLDTLLSGLSNVEVSILKHLLKSKYKGIK